MGVDEVVIFIALDHIKHGIEIERSYVIIDQVYPSDHIASSESC